MRRVTNWLVQRTFKLEIKYCVCNAVVGYGDLDTLRQYLRQYTYIDYWADDWLHKLLYALPLHGMLQQRDAANNVQDDDDELIGAESKRYGGFNFNLISA